MSLGKQSLMHGASRLCQKNGWHEHVRGFRQGCPGANRGRRPESGRCGGEGPDAPVKHRQHSERTMEVRVRSTPPSLQASTIRWTDWRTPTAALLPQRLADISQRIRKGLCARYSSILPPAFHKRKRRSIGQRKRISTMTSLMLAHRRGRFGNRISPHSGAEFAAQGLQHRRAQTGPALLSDVLGDVHQNQVHPGALSASIREHAYLACLSDLLRSDPPHLDSIAARGVQRGGCQPCGDEISPLRQAPTAQDPCMVQATAPTASRRDDRSGTQC